MVCWVPIVKIVQELRNECLPAFYDTVEQTFRTFTRSDACRGVLAQFGTSASSTSQAYRGVITSSAPAVVLPADVARGEPLSGEPAGDRLCTTICDASADVWSVINEGVPPGYMNARYESEIH